MPSRPSVLGDLTREEQLLLMRFVCSFAWADGRILPEERALVSRLVQRLGLAGPDVAQVESWLSQPPDPASTDSAPVPPRHRRLFLRALESVITVDGEVAPAEREALIRFARMED